MHMCWETKQNWCCAYRLGTFTENYRHASLCILSNSTHHFYILKKISTNLFCERVLLPKHAFFVDIFFCCIALTKYSFLLLKSWWILLFDIFWHKVKRKTMIFAWVFLFFFFFFNYVDLGMTWPPFFFTVIERLSKSMYSFSKKTANQNTASNTYDRVPSNVLWSWSLQCFMNVIPAYQL